MIADEPSGNASLPELTEATANPDPFRQFQLWYDQVLAAGLPMAEAAALATATADGRPSARMVLLRGVDERGFVFFTNYESRKAHELAGNPWAALAFYWARLERQVRVEGRVQTILPAESDAYFRSRPYGSQLSAWASEQSQVVAGRDVLERRMEQLRRTYPAAPVPRPPQWGGYRVVPTTIEFWQGRPDRLHDRLRYRRDDKGRWLMERLAP